MISSIRRLRGVAVVGTALIALLLAAQPTFALTKFGANLSGGPWFPSNAYPGQLCDHELNGGSGTETCTWILNQAFNGGSVTAPSNGTINKVKIINGAAGSFKLVLARKNSSGQFKVVSRSTTVSYSKDPCNPDCVVHKYSISPLPVSTGMYVGIQASKTSTLRCDSGGARTYLFTPVLNPGGGYTTPSGSTGCFLLVQAVYAS